MGTLRTMEKNYFVDSDIFKNAFCFLSVKSLNHNITETSKTFILKKIGKDHESLVF